LILYVKFFRLPIAKHLDNLKIDDVAIAQRIFVARGEVAVNAVLDLCARAAHTNRFPDKQGRVLLHAYVALVVQDSFRRGRRNLRSGRAAQKRCR
jgi:hypothetical protein